MRQVPVAEFGIQIVQMAGGGARGLFGIHAVVGVRRLFQAVLIAAPFHELPHAAGRHAGHGARDEAGFRLRQVDQFLRHALLVQNALDHRPVAAGALNGRQPSSGGRGSRSS